MRFRTKGMAGEELRASITKKQADTVVSVLNDMWWQTLNMPSVELDAAYAIFKSARDLLARHDGELRARAKLRKTGR